MFPKARKIDLVVQESGKELLVYDLNTNKALCLNSTSVLIWQKCDGERTLGQIRQEISKELGKKVNEDFVWFALSQLHKENLLEEIGDFDDGFKGLNRREVIKKIGLTSVVTLPIIASLSAPMAVNAQSCTPRGQSCTTSTQCCPTMMGLSPGCCRPNNMGTMVACRNNNGFCLP